MIKSIELVNKFESEKKTHYLWYIQKKNTCTATIRCLFIDSRFDQINAIQKNTKYLDRSII